jgi:hypothetical protein
MQIETQGLKNKVSKIQGLEEYLTLNFLTNSVKCHVSATSNQ